MRPEKLIKPKWHCSYNPGSQCFELYLSLYENHNVYIAKNVAFVEQEDGSYPDPFLILEEDQVQQLMDTLWTGGLRPTEGHGSAGQIGATEKHLEDMRKIVFETILPFKEK